MAANIACTVHCACQKVALSVRGSPVHHSWCHCTSCKKFHQTSPVPFIMFKADSVDVQGQEYVRSVNLSTKNFFGGKVNRHFCKECGFRLFNQPDGLPFRGIPAMNLRKADFKPSMHTFCSESDAAELAKFKDDGLPKYRDVPKDSGGSGELLAERTIA